jgi:hypothetical protein
MDMNMQLYGIMVKSNASNERPQIDYFPMSRDTSMTENLLEDMEGTFSMSTTGEQGGLLSPKDAVEMLTRWRDAHHDPKDETRLSSEFVRSISDMINCAKSGRSLLVVAM